MGMKMPVVRALFYAAFLLVSLSSAPLAMAADEAPLYLDPKQPIPVRVEDLLGRMTLGEKIGQLNLPCAYVDELGKTPEERMEAARKFARRRNPLRKQLESAGIDFTLQGFQGLRKVQFA